MATRPVVITKEPLGIRGAVQFFWETLGDADSGEAVSFPVYKERTVQITGTYGSATVVLEGSLDGTNYTTLDDIYGTALSYTSGNKVEGIGPMTMYVRPRTSGGTGTDLDVTILAIKNLE